MNIRMNDGPERVEPESDERVRDALAALDPAQGDPNYWMRFTSSVLNDASFELARRRRAASETIGGVLNAWSRTLMPTALVAAAAAAMLLVQSPEEVVTTSAGVEELLVSEIPTETVPVLLSPDAAQGVVAFASDEF